MKGPGDDHDYTKLRHAFERLPVTGRFGPFLLRDISQLLEAHSGSLAGIEGYVGEGHPRLTGHAIELDPRLDRPRLLDEISRVVLAIASTGRAPDIGGDFWASYLLWRHPLTAPIVTTEASVLAPSIPRSASDAVV